ncbi:uncharacterized protein Bfra_011857 [Botrytis fragariae]|uniref:Uncharacterized protein n=1 Tax=Botrytis fragariae TaxID=1964551 RepID=A0A8H6EE25_9HELO|nr:uncharacterized protein Bfra_011857 [Botrytis fragariae]KAF5868892.1 hypothetical protein Bfra_011857 [Botrytis fragariae]
MISYYEQYSFIAILSSHVKLREVYQNTLRARHNPIFINTLGMPVVMNRDVSLCQLGDDAIAGRLLYVNAHWAAKFNLRLEHHIQRQSIRRSNLVNHHVVVTNVLELQVKCQTTTSSAVKRGTYLSENRISFFAPTPSRWK